MLFPITVQTLDFCAQVWDTNHILNERSTTGELLRALFGYNGNPSLEEVLGYLIYWMATLLGLRWWMERKFAEPGVMETA